MYIDAGIHAREWIGPATATFMLKELLKAPLEDRSLLNEIDWYFVPVLNPDGNNSISEVVIIANLHKYLLRINSSFLKNLFRL